MVEQDAGNPNDDSRKRDLGTKRPGLMQDAPMETMVGLANQTGEDSRQTTIFNPDRRHGPVAGTCRLPTPTVMGPRRGQNLRLTIISSSPVPHTYPRHLSVSVGFHRAWKQQQTCNQG